MRTAKKKSTPRKKKAAKVPKIQRICEVMKDLPSDASLAQVNHLLWARHKQKAVSSELTTARRRLGIAVTPRKGVDTSLTVEDLIRVQEFVNWCGGYNGAIAAVKALQKVGERLGFNNGS